MTAGLTLLMLIISIFLNLARCTFIELFVGIAFFANVYIWRIFNVFLMLKLNAFLFLSIVIDLIWEIMRAIHYSSNYESEMKKIRLLGLIFSFINILIKLVLCFLYWKLSKEDQSGHYLDLEKNNSIHVVDQNDYLLKSTTMG